MINPAALLTTIELDKERRLLFDFNALSDFEDATGESLMGEGLNLRSIKAIRAAVWAGLLHEDSTLHVRDVGSWIYPGNLQYVMDRLAEALQLAAPEKEDSGDDAGEVADEPIPFAGSTPGPSPGTTSDSVSKSSGNLRRVGSRR